MIMNEENTAALIEAVCTHQIEEVAQLLTDGTDPNGIIDEAALTPLHFAVSHESTESILLLLSVGANCLQEYDDGESALEKAIQLNRKDAVKIFAFHLGINLTITE